MAYLGNLTCRDCGLTFTSRWGSYDDVDEYRCSNDHVVHASATSGVVIAVDGVAVEGEVPAGGSGVAPTLVDLRGRCPRCSTELATGLLPTCPVCGGRDHDVLVAGTLT